MVEKAIYFAHSTSDPSQSDWQRLADHLASVAALAETFGDRLGLAPAAHLAGLLHDAGKYTAAFQARLKGAPQKVEHAIAGAALVTRLAPMHDKIIAEIVSYAIAGHHAGLPDMHHANGGLVDRIKSFDQSLLDEIWRSEISPIAVQLTPQFLQKPGGGNALAFRLQMLGRMIFSCLVDADFKDTEVFYNNIEGKTADRIWPSLASTLPLLIDSLNAHLERIASVDSQVNRLRADVLRHVRARASVPPGLFTLTVPTGGGKTLASLAFALEHARAHGLDRIIYAIPFTSIVDQTADIFRAVLGNDIVLEHHASLEDEKMTSREARDKLRLAMEDWAAPIIVTTNVQLFESLYSSRGSSARKLHNMARSVIVLDEAQTIPRPLMIPCVRAIDALATDYGCTVVLCTATQPALDTRHFPKGRKGSVALQLQDRELAPDPEDLARRLRRVTLRFAGNMSNEALIAELASVAQGLVIVNSRTHALALYQGAKASGLDGLIHLTTRQVAAHRRQILTEIRRRLSEHEPCRVIATSLVEAGVDVDFPRVWRAEAGLDQIAQAAGRCNREGKRDPEASLVTVFAASDYPPPREIKGMISDFKRMAEKHIDLLSPAALADYFGEQFWRLGEDLDKHRVMNSFKIDIAKGTTNFAYRTVGEQFRMIESGMLPVIVPWDAKSKAAVENLKVADLSSGKLARELQSYIVQIPPNARAKLMANGHVVLAAERLRAGQFAVLKTLKFYSDETGLIWEEPDDLGLKEFVF